MVSRGDAPPHARMISLQPPHLANVHVKNVEWERTQVGWLWEWAALEQGMVQWPYLASVLEKVGYQGQYAMEDFLAPGHSKEAAMSYLRTAGTDFREILSAASGRDARDGLGERVLRAV